jgi:hypothetical protein
MEENADARMTANILGFSIISTIILGITLFMYVIVHDYIMYNLYQVIQNLYDGGLLSSFWFASAEATVPTLQAIPTMIDILWFASFLLLIWDMVYVSYKTSRRGYFDVLSFVSYGIMVFLFLLSIFKTVNDWIYDFFFNSLLQNLTVELTFFSFYLDNMFIITTILLLVMILINFIDFNELKFTQRKQEEKIEI